MKFFNIPSNYNFLESLYNFILMNFNNTNLSNLIIFLPSRRSVNELKRIFIKNKKIIFLPNIKAIGDIDYDDIILNNLNYNILQKITTLTRTISNIKYKLLSIEEFSKKYSLKQSIQLTEELNNFLLEIKQNNCDLNKLDELVDEEYSIYWQNILYFLKTFVNRWQKILNENNITNIESYRIETIKYYIENFNNLETLKNPIIIAGNSLTNNNIISLVESLLRFDNSYFIFKGYENIINTEDKKYINEFHSHYLFYNFLDKLNIKEKIKDLKYDDFKIVDDNIIYTIYYSSLPSELVYKWKELKINSLDHIEAIECDNILEEIKAITFYLLDYISKNNLTNIAVISNIEYSDILEENFKFYNIPTNNTFGTKFSNNFVSNLLFLIIDLAIDNFKIDNFFDFLKNKNFIFHERKEEIKELENLILKEQINAINLDGYIKESIKYNLNNLNKFLLEIQDIFKPILIKKEILLENLSHFHLEIFQKCIKTEILSNKENKKIIEFMINFNKENKNSFKINLEDYKILLKYFLSKQSYIKEFSLFPAVNIIKLEESKLINYDLIILFNCNEGVYPEKIANDSWLNNNMRKIFGLFSKNISIGKNYYDFIQLLSQKKILITRSLKKNNTVTFKSRFLERLEILLKMHNCFLKNNNEILKFVRYDNSVNEKNKIIIERPNPKANFSKIKNISATNFETLIKNPYDFYVKYFLQLKENNILNNLQKITFVGNFIHLIFENFVNNYEKYKNNIDILTQELLDNKFYNNKIIIQFYKKRIFLIAKKFYNLDKEIRLISIKSITEKNFSYKMNNYDINLFAKIDRIDFYNNKDIGFVDYKTGSDCSLKSLINGLEKQQLIFTAYILSKNNYNIKNFGIWKTSVDKFKKTIIQNDIDNMEEILSNTEKFIQLVFDYFYLNGKFKATNYNLNSNFKHICRVDEWLYNK